MNRLYEALKEDPYFKNKLHLGEADNKLRIVFHKHLWLAYTEGNYTASFDEGYLELQGSYPRWAAHWHIQSDEDAIAAITEFAGEDTVYIENPKPSTIFPLAPRMKTMDRKKFEQKQEKYLAKKHLCIYTANEIIKTCGAKEK